MTNATYKDGRWGYAFLAIALLVVTAVYWPGLYGGWLFDDYPNIVDNAGLHLAHASIPDLINAALSSPASEFKRPLASLTFAANYLLGGLDPFWMKLTNLVIHLANGLLVFFLTRELLSIAAIRKFQASRGFGQDITATMIAGGWMLLPINLTGVLYVVQRMESLANLFVLLGLLGYVCGRQYMLHPSAWDGGLFRGPKKKSLDVRGFLLCCTSLAACTAIGLMAKETAAMLPLYAALIEFCLFGFKKAAFDKTAAKSADPAPKRNIDHRIAVLFVVTLVLPMMIGLAKMLPGVLADSAWVSRDFTLRTRLLSETRIVIDYIRWTLLPTPDTLSFYYDNFKISTGLFSPWTTSACVMLLAALIVIMLWLRRKQPLVSLGIGFFLGCHLLTATILPLELVYEHRNYFASFGLLLAIVPLLVAAPSFAYRTADPGTHSNAALYHDGSAVPSHERQPQSFLLPRRLLLVILIIWWAVITAVTAYAWGNPLRLAQELAARAPDSPRAQYELGRTYIIYSHYDPASPFTKLAYAPLEQSASLPGSSILPEQALIYMNSRMHLPLRDAWWDSLTNKLRSHNLGVQDESSLAALTECARSDQCDLPKQRMVDAFLAAMSHPKHSARLLAIYGDYAWNVLGDKDLGVQLTAEASASKPEEPAYRITLIRMLVAEGRAHEANEALSGLEKLNLGGRLNENIGELRNLLHPSK